MDHREGDASASQTDPSSHGVTKAPRWKRNRSVHTLCSSVSPSEANELDPVSSPSFMYNAQHGGKSTPTVCNTIARGNAPGLLAPQPHLHRVPQRGTMCQQQCRSFGNGFKKLGSRVMAMQAKDRIGNLSFFPRDRCRPLGASALR
jgi:hypothetical protein